MFPVLDGDGGMANVVFFRSKLAKLKRTTAKDLGKRSKPLGRRFQRRIDGSLLVLTFAGY